jgi:hypothetical protein
MSTLTPIGARLQMALDAEYLRMQNEWFFKWHHIGRDRVIEIDGFDGRMIRYVRRRPAGTTRPPDAVDQCTCMGRLMSSPVFDHSISLFDPPTIISSSRSNCLLAAARSDGQGWPKAIAKRLALDRREHSGMLVSRGIRSLRRVFL